MCQVVLNINPENYSTKYYLKNAMISSLHVMTCSVSLSTFSHFGALLYFISMYGSKGNNS